MQVVVLTYPGHFFITKLCIESIRRHYPETTQIHVLFDDSARGLWQNYGQNCREYYQNGVQCYPYGSIDPTILQCPVGWWRQQLVKLCIDKLLTRCNEWFVVDGDVIFDERINIQKITPVHDREVTSSPTAIMVARYVDYMLGSNNSRVQINNRTVITSSIPFRWLDRAGLMHLRKIAEEQMQKDFILGHNEMFLQGNIVGHDETASKMVMHEWELFEAYNNVYRHDDYKVVETGSGYHTTADTSKCIPGHRFRHSSLVDTELGKKWLRQQGLIIPKQIWTKCVNWSESLQRTGR